MPTNISSRCEVRTVSIAAPPATVFDVASDLRKLPLWAPGAARSVRPDGEAWIVENGETSTRVMLRASRQHGTIDMLSADDPSSGVFARVIPNGAGSEYQFTLLFPPEVPEAAITEQLKIVDDELQALRALCEAES